MPVLFKEMKFTIHTTHCDFKDFLRPAAVFDFFQDVAGLHAKEIGVGYEDVLKKGYYWIVLYQKIEVVSRIPSFSEEVMVRTWPKERSRLEFEREYELRDLDGNLLIKGISIWVLIDKETRSLTKGLDVVFNGEYYSKTNYPDKMRRKITIETTDLVNQTTYKVLLSDLDHNFHMNNAKYLDVIYNTQSIESYRTWKQIEISFLHEAKLHETIHVEAYQKDEIEYYKGNIDGQACFEAKVEWEA